MLQTRRNLASCSTESTTASYGSYWTTCCTASTTNASLYDIAFCTGLEQLRLVNHALPNPLGCTKVDYVLTPSAPGVFASL